MEYCQADELLNTPRPDNLSPEEIGIAVQRVTGDKKKGEIAKAQAQLALIRQNQGI